MYQEDEPSRLDRLGTKELPGSLPMIGVVGHMSSGKGAIGKILKQRFGFEIYSLSDTIRDYARAQGRTLSTRFDYISIKEEIARELGDDYFIDKTLERARNDYTLSAENSFPGVVIDGFRIPSNVPRLLARFPGTVLIGITADQTSRFKRRDPIRPENRLTRKEFNEIEAYEGKGVDEILQMPNVIHFKHNSSLQELEEQAISVVSRVFGLSPKT